jgi:cytochrome c6
VIVLKRILILVVALTWFCWGPLGWGQVGWAAEVAPSSPSQSSPATLFDLHCAGCHPNGGNIIRRGKTLKAQALKRYGYVDAPEISTLIRQGKGNMSAFVDRLSSAEIDQLASYVLAQAQQGWH